MVTAASVTDDDPDGDWTASGVFRCAPDVYRIPLPLPQDGLRAVNVFAVADADGWTLIDSGWAIDEARELLEGALKALGSDFGDVRRFLVTHAHRDHYTLASMLRREFGARVMVGAGERPNFDAMHAADHRPGSTDATRLRRAGADDIADFILDHPWPQPDPREWEDPDEWVADRAVIELGEPGEEPVRRLEAVETPGHTRGHLVFADDASDLLFAGDHVLPRITPSIGLQPAPVTSPLAQFLTSLELLRTRPDAQLLPAHGPLGRRVHERVDELLAHHATRLDASLAAVAAGATSGREVAERLRWTRREHRLDDLDLFNKMLAVMETTAHLDVLVERGALGVAEIDGVARYQLA
ncbi:glyoxylase-like metal-dependent hydrolase (beta-lactamase superfamily II) [Pseudonocardia endophytica]|uniref:Glyoxylase-like metal-dependent hydrolase (Beta-lactamase superfamily II) n=1 Tax=Pseudonocardia endophytica TaxID=401976 RepID=A0A4R1HW52_PSEEN|nr:glyoxylase-like metal-dependent hydrolase (beta-lactamase superfamily II) [Pseudonocardia endophytica]